MERGYWIAVNLKQIADPDFSAGIQCRAINPL